MTDFRNNILTAGSRGLRTNNPGNIKGIGWSGQVGSDNVGQAVFSSVEYGIRAMAQNLVNQQRLHNLSTLQKIFDVYAPASDGNNPTWYANYLGNKLGTGGNDAFKINESNLPVLLRAVISVELGQKFNKFISDEMIQEGIRKNPEKILAWLKNNSGKSAVIILIIAAGLLFLKSNNHA